MLEGSRRSAILAVNIARRARKDAARQGREGGFLVLDTPSQTWDSKLVTILHISRAGRGKEALLVITELIINQSLTVGNFTVQQNAHPQVTLCCLGSGLSRVKASCGQEGHKILADGRRHTLAAYYVAYASNQFRDTRSGARCKTHQLVPVLSNREGQRENPTPLSA